MAIQNITYANKSYVNQNANVAATNKISDTDMNEIKNVVNNNATELENTNNNVSNTQTLINNVKGKILWTNPSPSLSFSSQNITLNSSDYDIIEIFYRSTPSFSNYRGSIRVLKGGSGEITLSDTGTFSGVLQNCIILRTFAYTNDTTYDISRAQYRYGTSGSYQVDDILVPLYVVGYKLEIF